MKIRTKPAGSKLTAIASYQRSFDLSGIDESSVQAAYADGVLKLTLPKAKEEKTETHQVKIA